MTGPSWLQRFGRRTAPDGGPPTAPPRPPSSFGRRLGRAGGVVWRELYARLRQLVRLAVLVVEVIIAVRILFKVAGANANAGFSSFIYKLSAPFVDPFHPVFADSTVNGHPFEVGSLLAMAVYALIAYLAVRVFRVVFAPGR